MRPFAEGDAEAVFAIFSEPDVGRWVGGAHATIDDSRGLIRRASEHQRANAFAMWAVEERETGALVGEVGLQLLELKGPEVEIGWTIGRPWWRRGYATEAAGAWLGVAFGEVGLDEVIATVLPENEPSHRVARRIGMTPAPRRHVWGAEHDIYVAERRVRRRSAD